MKVEIINLLNTILEQNYFEHNGNWYKQNDGLALGAPTSTILTETFVQHLEHTIIVDILKKYQIIKYHRYVDDTLIIHNTRTTDINNILHKLNKVHARIKFTVEDEFENKINFLNISIAKAHNKLQL